MNTNIASAVFDSREDAQRALTELRTAGIPDSAVSLVGKQDEHSSGDNDDDNYRATDGSGNDAKSDVTKGAIIGTGAGALLGIAALAIPGVGPLAAAGAIAASAVPTGAAIGAGAGLAVGSLAGLLADHGVDEDDSKYYESRVHDGGTFVSVDADQAGVPVEEAREILYRAGGHSATRARETFA